MQDPMKATPPLPMDLGDVREVKPEVKPAKPEPKPAFVAPPPKPEVSMAQTLVARLEEKLQHRTRVLARVNSGRLALEAVARQQRKELDGLEAELVKADEAIAQTRIQLLREIEKVDPHFAKGKEAP